MTGRRAAPARPPTTHRVFGVRGNPVVSVPVSGPGRWAGLRRLPTSTARRSAFRAGVTLASAVGVDRWAADPRSGALPVELGPAVAARVLAELGRLGGAPGDAVVMWPPQSGRGRVYVHGFDAAGRPVAFVKVGLGERNRHRLRREVEALRELAARPPGSFSVPAVLASHRVDDAAVVVFEPLPAGARSPRRAAFPELAHREIGGGTGRAADVTGSSWWPAYRRRADGSTPAFDAELAGLLPAGAPLARAHGDLGPHNMAAGDRLWLLDWEESAADAPVLTDPVGFALSVGARRIAASPRDGVDVLRRGLGRSPEPSRRDLVLALAFRRARGFDDVLAVLRHWDRSAGWGAR